MGRRCCIAGCTSASRLPEHHGVTYHSFPVDENTRAIWMKNARIGTDRPITKSVLVCSRHFRRADFQPQRSGKYLLKQKVFPTVFPWGKVDASQIEEDLEFLNSTAGSAPAPANLLSNAASSVDEDTKATVAATVAQIMAQTAELNAQAALKADKSLEASDDLPPAADGEFAALAGVKFEPVTTFTPGARLEAQDFDGVWHSARIVEVDNDDREVLIKFEKTGKTKLPIVGTEEWIPMNSSRLRLKVSNKAVPIFSVEEKCLARWTGPRKFPGTVKKVLPNDTYEILFDDGYVKNVRAIHMNKMLGSEVEATEESAATEATPPPAVLSTSVSEAAPTLTSTPLHSPAVKRPASRPSTSTGKKKRNASASKKDWPLLDLSKLDIESLNLPEIPKDGEWTCHWVNDQPIGQQGYLLVGEHRKPTVIVEDWRLPTGWIKHMYQRSNVLGKWDVILVSPVGKRFRSKADLKTFLEEQGQVYNPDVYDFSIHRRRAKDINCYVYTPGYVPQQPAKPKSSFNLNDSVGNKSSPALAALPAAKSPYMETPIAEPLPPMELLTSSSLAAEDKSVTQVEAEVPKQLLESAEASSTPTPTTTPTVGLKDEAAGAAAEEAQGLQAKVEDGYAMIGSLKVKIVDNLFRCPEEGCSKNFRKENHLQIHVKHYHRHLAKLLGTCPKMQELAEKRTHPIETDTSEPAPKNQIPNQQFFAKLHQQDLEQTRAHRRKISGDAEGKTELSESAVKDESTAAQVAVATTLDESSNVVEANESNTTANDSTLPDQPPLSKRSRFSPSKRPSGSRKSNRQRTTRKYLTAAQATAALAAQNTSLPPLTIPPPAESSFSGVTDFEETRHSFNATPELPKESSKKRRSNAPPVTPLSSVESPITADSGSSSQQPLSTAEVESQYIKENGELIKIVRMRQEEIINCLCGYVEEDGLMIQCELCLCWQHGMCNGIDKESQVPDKYVCFTCRNPLRIRESIRFKHDQDWLYEGKLPTANYHTQDAQLLAKRADFLKRSHTLTGNLLELKNFMHSLRVKLNITSNKCHPKLYLWAKTWDDEGEEDKKKNEIKSEIEENDKETKKSPKPETPAPVPNIPQPEAAIDPVECQQRLQEHIRIQQDRVMERLNQIEKAIDVLEEEDDMPDLKNDEIGATKDALAAFIKEMDIMKKIAKLSALEHTKTAIKNQPLPV